MNIGRSSYMLAQVARQGDVTRIYSEATVVFADENGPTAIPVPIRAALERLLLPQSASLPVTDALDDLPVTIVDED